MNNFSNDKIILEIIGQTEKSRGSSVNYVYSVANSNDSKAEKVLKRDFCSNRRKMHKTGIDVWLLVSTFCHCTTGTQT